jgi:hypothetical protein
MFDSKLHSAFQNFLIKQSGGNIINIKSLSVQGNTRHYGTGFNSMVTFERKLLIECTCVSSNYFLGIENLNERFLTFFKTYLNGISDVQIHYHYSMYCCRD